jgi:hypothetical protein
MVIDSAGVLHVVWGDTSGVHLATRFGTTWYVERVTATTNTGVKIVVGPTGKVAISTAVNPMPFAIFE